MPLLVWLALSFALVGVALDNYSTWVALTAFAGQVKEINPIARFEFYLLGGPTPALIITFLMAIVLGTIIAYSGLFERNRTKILILTLWGVTRWAAALNNFVVISILTDLMRGV